MLDPRDEHTVHATQGIRWKELTSMTKEALDIGYGMEIERFEKLKTRVQNR